MTLTAPPLIKLKAENYPIVFWIGAAITMVVLVITILHFGEIQFGGFDGSILINHAWQLHLNYRPYVDVVTGWPPIQLIGSRLAFDWWGVHWRSLVTAAAIFSALTFLLQSALLHQQGFNSVTSLLISFTFQTMTMMVISWWWYNQITAAIGTLFVSSAALFYRQPRNRFGQLAFVGTAALLSLSKPNVAGVLLASVAAIFVLIRPGRPQALLLLGCSFVLAMTILFLENIDPKSLLVSYSAYAGGAFTVGRMISFLLLNNQEEALQTFVALVPGVLAVVLLLLRFRFSRSLGKSKNRLLITHVTIKENEAPLLLLSFTSIATGIWGMMTNNDYNMSDATLVLLGIILVYSLARNQISEAIVRKSVSILLMACFALFIIMGLVYTTTRQRVAGVGMGAFYEVAPLTQLTSPPLFQGMWAGPRLARVLNEIQSLLEQKGYAGRADAAVFFGPRIDFAYAAYGIHPYPGIPTWWEFFSKDGRGQTNLMIERFRRANFELCIFLHQDFTYLPTGLLQYLNIAYTSFDKGELTVYVHK